MLWAVCPPVGHSPGFYVLAVCIVHTSSPTCVSPFPGLHGSSGTFTTCGLHPFHGQGAGLLEPPVSKRPQVDDTSFLKGVYAFFLFSNLRV